MEKIWTTKIDKILNKYLQGEAITRSNNFLYHNLQGTLNSKFSVLLTKDEAIEYSKCSNDIVYFIERHLNIKLHKYQIEWIENYKENRFLIYMVSRQSGLSTILSCIFLHQLIFSNVNICIQDKGNMIDKIWNNYIKLPYYLKPNLLSKNSKCIKFSDSQISNKSNIVVDQNDIFFTTNINDLSKNLPTITSKNNSKIILEWRNESKFNDIVKNSLRKDNDKKKNVFKTIKTYWWEYMTTDQKEEAIKTFGQDMFDKEFDLEI